MDGGTDVPPHGLVSVQGQSGVNLAWCMKLVKTDPGIYPEADQMVELFRIGCTMDWLQINSGWLQNVPGGQTGI